ncbi:MAG: hypothetical protein NC043_07015 [Muribaculaceae bacterium]|nr:hypothetical protein [Muribaculaceae bacterium]
MMHSNIGKMCGDRHLKLAREVLPLLPAAVESHGHNYWLKIDKGNSLHKNLRTGAVLCEFNEPDNLRACTKMLEWLRRNTSDVKTYREHYYNG